MKLFNKLASVLLVGALAFIFVACSGGNTASPEYPILTPTQQPESSGENYTEIVENEFVSTITNPNSYFSIDANTASYPNLRSLINNGHSIPKDAVRVEEMLNYFNYDYPTPEDGEVFSVTGSLFDTPYNSQTKLLTIGISAQKIEFSNIKNNIVFLIDVSGSMYSADKLPLVQEAFRMLAENLNPEDRVSIVTYAGDDRVALSGAYGHEKQKITAVIEDLVAGGSTAGSAGITTAYEIAQQYFIEGGNNRVVLATDGDFNVGLKNVDELESFIAQKRQTGVYFSVFGVGRGNVQSDKMEALALAGNGVCSYIDSQKEARRALVEQIGGSMVTVAKDVKAGITFDKQYVESYRLIGYENKLLTQEEFEDSTTDAGEIGSGHTLTVMYEIKMTNKEFVSGEEIAQVTLKYKPTVNVGGNEIEVDLVAGIKTDDYHAEPTTNDMFVASVVEFALILRDSKHKANANLNDLVTRLDCLDLSDDEYKEEFREIVRKYRNTVEG
ncbi:MAG: von Willebrand factor type A domain-containing protein [Clostridia bacterium]|nr:von Willebrand factor type A domain-containing protein [Clostridia bacterium]